MAAMIGTRNEQDLVKMLDARSEYGRALKRDYFKPKSEVDSPTGVFFKRFAESVNHCFLSCAFLFYVLTNLAFSLVFVSCFLSCGCTI